MSQRVDSAIGAVDARGVTSGAQVGAGADRRNVTGAHRAEARTGEDPSQHGYRRRLPRAVDRGHGCHRVRRGAAGVRRGAAGGRRFETRRGGCAGGSTKGKIDTIAAIKGTVDCGDHAPGSSTVKITGSTPEGMPLTSDGAVTVDEILPAVSHRYTAGGGASVTAEGAQLRADVVRQNVVAPAPHLHVEGDLVCGPRSAG